MSVINQVCGTTSTVPKNLGGKKQCIEAPVKTLFLAKDSFSFASITAMKDVANWNAAIAAKNIVPLPNTEGIEQANTEAIIKNGRYRDYTLKNGVAGVAYRFDLSICTYEALKSYVSSSFNRVFEITEAEEVSADVQTDGTVKGRKITSLLLSQRNGATDADVPFANVNLKFDSDVYDIIRAEFEVTEVEGVYDVALEVIGTPTSTELVVKATLACSGDLVTSLVLADWKFTESAGTEETVTASSYDPETGYYTLTAVAFVTGTIATDGVVTQTNIKYEAAAVAVTVA